MGKISIAVGDAICSTVYSSFCVSSSARETLGFYVVAGGAVLIVGFLLTRWALAR